MQDLPRRNGPRMFFKHPLKESGDGERVYPRPFNKKNMNMHTKLITEYLSLFCLASVQAVTPPGFLDTNYYCGSGITGQVGSYGFVHSFAIAPEGKVFVGGNFTSVHGSPRSCIALLAADGNVDASFNPSPGANNEVLAVACQADGKAVIGGLFSSVNRTSRNRIARLNTDGSLDTSFDPGQGPNSAVRVVRVQADGKILVGGEFTRLNGVARSCVARLNADGTVDATFDPGTGVGGYLFVNAMAIQNDGRILIGGDFSKYNGVARGSIARLHPDGSLDPSFDSGKGTTLDNPIMSIALQSDGKIMIAGSFYTYQGTRRVNLARLNTDGSLDTTFNPGSGISGGPYNMILCIAVQTDDKILVAGAFDNVNGVKRSNFVRLNPSGSLDTNFTTEVDSPVRYVATQTDGKILIGGQFYQVDRVKRSRFARFNAEPIVPPTMKMIHWQKRPEGFRCEVQGAPSATVVVEASSDLAQWGPVVTNLCANGVLDFNDPDIAFSSQRFYRLRTAN